MVYLKSLTLRGFKSFASATTLNFEPGITCVVGPNGSGKSNVVDALSWVMGEQGAKSLRGGKMEDVIFAGTSGRAPLGRAEVLLTIDNTDGALPIDYTEVTISRTMFRNGGSEYAINGHAARLLDVQDLLSDSGIGREMHVIVGQGQLDSILQATPEGRRGFIEEAAGVLKHRKRKEKALRKLEACEGNLTRLQDLITEIRRQLKPLGRQAEVARKAAVVQADVRDAKARLIADDLVQVQLSMASDLADERAMKQRRLELENALETARAVEVEAEQAVRACVPRLNTAQETWYSLAALKERVASTASIARERMRNADNDPGETRVGRDPDELEREADAVAAQEAELAREVAQRGQTLTDATTHRTETELAHQREEARLAALVRAAADRREGLARLTGQVNSLRSRAEAAEAEIGRLAGAHTEAVQRAEQAGRAFTSLETQVAGLDDGELGLDSAHEEALEAKELLEAELGVLRTEERAATQERAALAARLRGAAGRSAPQGRDRCAAGGHRARPGSARFRGRPALGARRVRDGRGRRPRGRCRRGRRHRCRCGPGCGRAAEDRGPGSGRPAAGERRRPEPTATDDRAEWPSLPEGAVYAVDVVETPPDIARATRRLLRKIALVDDLPAARTLVDRLPDLTAVTTDGDLLSTHYAAGGSNAQPSLIEVQAAVDDAEQRLAEAHHRCERLRFGQTELEERLRLSNETVEATLARLHESDAAMAALAEELGQLSSASRSAHAEADRLLQGMARAEEARDRDLGGLADLERRLELAQEAPETEEPDPAERDRLAEAARHARSAEMDARLALRTMEERVRALAGRSDALRRAAAHERAARAKAQARRERMLREAKVAAGVHAGAGYLARRIETSIALAGVERAAADAARTDAEAALAEIRGRLRTLTHDFESLVDTVHRDEMARAEQRMRLEALTEKAMTELGLEPDGLVADYGPDQPVPVLTTARRQRPGPRRRGAGADPVRARAAAEAAADGGARARGARAGEPAGAGGVRRHGGAAPVPLRAARRPEEDPRRT